MLVWSPNEPISHSWSPHIAEQPINPMTWKTCNTFRYIWIPRVHNTPLIWSSPTVCSSSSPPKPLPQSRTSISLHTLSTQVRLSVSTCWSYKSLQFRSGLHLWYSASHSRGHQRSLGLEVGGNSASQKHSFGLQVYLPIASIENEDNSWALMKPIQMMTSSCPLCGHCLSRKCTQKARKLWNSSVVSAPRVITFICAQMFCDDRYSFICIVGC